MIKFRAWDKLAKVMIYHIEQTYDGLGDFQENKNIEDYVSDISFGCFADWLEDDQFVIMQSTGLFDKNKNEVFVGDEIRCTSGCPHEVYIEKEYGGTFIGGMPTIYLKGIDQGYAWTGDEEILGNIYELESVEE